MKNKAHLAALLAAGLLTAGTAAADDDAKPRRDCFWANQVNGFTVVDDRHVDVTVGAGRIYRLTLFSRSSDIDFSNAIGLESRGGLSICSGLDATVIVPSTIGPRRFPVTEVRRLGKDEIAAAKAKRD